MANSSIPKSISAPSAIDIGLILLCALIWASAFIGIKIAVVDFQPIMVAFSRVSIGSLLLFFYVWLQPLFKRQTSWPTGRANWVKLCFIAILYTAVPFSLISWGQQYVSASLTSIIMGSSPLIGFIIAHFTTRDEKLNRYKFMALITGLLGVYLAVDFSGNEGLTSGIWGIIAIFAALICYSVSGLITRSLTNGSTENISAAVLGLATMFLIPALFISGQYPSDFDNLSNDAIWALIYLGLFPTGVAYLIRFHLILKIGFTAFLTSIFFIPIFGVFLSALLLGEELTMKIFLALSILVASLFISRLGNKKLKQKRAGQA
ncbi:MAG: hypothetical protein COB24_09140 [Hyphomicrobiales bacterium]|nr:MAG: hypothetical protein COB24_09140 [Hyphomicrobiales bacterium]